ncbi:GntR family transcriptional regulator [Streptomyces shenzhenensis]|uniref:GntR family transcriptional regulator n=1 Tax=Streptomyces shenzhenensis TaxID=943815 RepID=UPI003D8B5BD9
MSVTTDTGEPFTALRPRESLRDATVRTLHAAVISGYLRPGSVYSARALGTQLGISATPVREAMLDLVKEGLVEAVPNKGFRVVQLTERELDELNELRQLIEVPTVRRIALKGIDDPVAIAELRELAEELVRSAREKNFIAHHVADLQFHLKLLAHGATTTWSSPCTTCASVRACTACPDSPTVDDFWPPRRSTSTCST